MARNQRGKMSYMPERTPPELMPNSMTRLTDAEERVTKVYNRGSSSVGPSTTMYFDLPQDGVLLPRNTYLEFTLNLTGTVPVPTNVSVASLFRQVRSYIGQQLIDQLDYFNLCEYAMSVCRADKWKYPQVAPANPSSSTLVNKGILTTAAGLTGQRWSIKFPVGLFSINQSIPLKFLPQISLQIDTDSAANALAKGTTLTDESFTISDVCLVINVIEPSPSYYMSLSKMWSSGVDLDVLIPSYMVTANNSSNVFPQFQINQNPVSAKTLLFFMRSVADQTASATYRYHNLDSSGTVKFIDQVQLQIGNDVLPSQPLYYGSASFIELMKGFNQNSDLPTCAISNQEYLATSQLAGGTSGLNKQILGFDLEIYGSQDGVSGSNMSGRQTTLKFTPNSASSGSALNSTCYAVVVFDIVLKVNPAKNVVEIIR